MKKLLALSILSCAVFSAPALASTTGSVGSPNVKKGKTDVAVRFGFSEADTDSSQDDRFRTRVQVDHGFTDFYAARLIVAQDDRKGDSYEHDSISFENRFHILKKEQYGFDFGVRATYAYKDGDKKSDNVAFSLYERVPYQGWDLRFNQIFKHDIGEEAEDGVGAELRFQATKEFTPTIRAGLESFHDFGNLTELSGYSDQAHTFGPVFKIKLPYDISLETGYRAGVSKGAPNHSFKTFFSRAF